MSAMNVQGFALLKNRTRGLEPKRCQSCDRLLGERKQKYCSPDCKKRLEHMLWTTEGFFQRLHTKYAALKWTRTTMELHVLPFGGTVAYRFVVDRTGSMKPCEDFGKMVDDLSTHWWDSHKETKSQNQATQKVFKRSEEAVHPISFTKLGKQTLKLVLSRIAKTNIKYLQLNAEDLLAPDRVNRIKTAFRQRAKVTHPDYGGVAEEFRRAKEASDQLMTMTEKPIIKTTKIASLPGCWLYDGNRTHKKWMPPSR